MGLTTHHGGTVKIGGVELAGTKASARAKAGMGYVPQTRDIFRSLTVEENLVAGLKGRGVAAIDEVYDLFPRLAERRRRYGLQLSGGEQQMLSLARTLLGKPSVLLLDEPLEGLAPILCDQLMSKISALAQSGDVTILLVEQQIGRALDFAEKAMVIERGRSVWSGDCVELRSNHELINRFLGVGIH
jgi:branched-chain amino acid transport system ATP-binding protein